MSQDEVTTDFADKVRTLKSLVVSAAMIYIVGEVV